MLHNATVEFDVNIPIQGSGVTPLCMAAKNGHIAVMRYVRGSDTGA